MAHDLIYLTTGTTASPCTIDVQGDLRVVWTQIEQESIENTQVYCNTCERFIFAPDHGLSDEWMAY